MNLNVIKPRGGKIDSQPHYGAITKLHKDGPSWHRALARPTNSRRNMHGGDRELIKLLLEDNQRLRESLVDLEKRFPSSSSNRDDHKSYTSHTPCGQRKADYDPPSPAHKGK